MSSMSAATPDCRYGTERSLGGAQALVLLCPSCARLRGNGQQLSWLLWSVGKLTLRAACSSIDRNLWNLGWWPLPLKCSESRCRMQGLLLPSLLRPSAVRAPSWHTMSSEACSEATRGSIKNCLLKGLCS